MSDHNPTPYTDEELKANHAVLFHSSFKSARLILTIEQAQKERDEARRALAVDEQQEYREFLEKMIQGIIALKEKMAEIAKLCAAASDNLKEFAEVFSEALEPDTNKDGGRNGTG